MANYSPQHRNESPGATGHWQQSVNHLQSAEGSIQYARSQNDASNNTNGTSNGTSFQRQEQPGSVITRMTPYTTPWNYSAEHIRIPAAPVPAPGPEPIGYTNQQAYPPGQAAPARIWNAVKDEPEDLTGRHTGNDKQNDAQTNTNDSDSDNDSDLCIDEQQRAGTLPRKRKGGISASVMNGVTPAELQKRPGLIPLTSNLAGPVQVMTAKDGAKLYSCPECNLFYADHLAFEIHLQAHGVSLGKRHVCKECGTSFRRREHLDAHMTAHSQDRPFSCETCGRAFKRNEHLTRHRVLHSGDKQHVCADCGKSFFRKDHLMKHSQTHMLRKMNSGEG